MQSYKIVLLKKLKKWREKMPQINIAELIREKFQSQTVNSKLPNVCPHCGKRIEFEFKHTQNTEVATELIKIEKGN